MNSSTLESQPRWKRNRSGPAVRALELCSLTALGVAYPLFQVLAGSPEFFVARGTTLPLLVGAAVAVCVALPAVVVLLELLASAVNERAAVALHSCAIFCLGALTTMPWIKRGASLDGYSAIAAACLAAAAFVALHRRLSGARMFVLGLAPAVIVVPALFVGNPAVYEAVAPTPQTFESPTIQSAPPIVFILFDELPLNSLLNDTFTVDAVRYPHVAELAAGSFWFRNAHTVHARTVRAVPSIQSGLYPNLTAVPTLQYYPDNIFTLLADSYGMTSFAMFSQLCPVATCTHDIQAPEESIGRLLSDLAIVYLHIVLPMETAQRFLPPIVGQWEGFAAAARGVDLQVSRHTREAEFDRFLSTIGHEKERQLYFLHTMLPHAPFEYVPSGRRYEGPTIHGLNYFNEQSQTFADAAQQRHLLQVGFVDTLVGRLVGRLRAVGIYDESMIVITADHGASFRAGTDFRRLDDSNYSDIMLVPLFVKLPGQTDGVVSDRNVALIDIVPTIADVLGFEIPYEVDGRSLIDFEAADNGDKIVSDTRFRRPPGAAATEPEAVRLVTIDDGIDHSLAAWEHKLDVFGSGDRYGLYSLGADASLIGQSTDARLGAAGSPVRLTLLNSEAFASVDTSSDVLPLYVAGRIDGDASSSSRVALTLNGRIAAITAPYLEDGTWWFSAVVPEEFLTPGFNEVGAFILGEASTGDGHLRDSLR